MKVLEITTMFGGGSVGRIAVDCYHVLEERGADCIIAYGRGVPPQNVKTYKIGNKFSILLHVLGTRFFDACGYGSTLATKRFIKFIKEYDPDVIHLHNLHGYYINVFLLFEYLKICGKRIIWTLHDCWSYTGHCPYYTLENCNKWKEGCEKCEKKRQHPQSFFYDGSSRNYSAKKKAFTNIPNMTIVTPSEWLKVEVEQSYLKEYPIVVINNGINQSVFRTTVGNIRDKLNIGDKFLILGVANVWGYAKGLDIFERLAEEIDSAIYQIVMVGLNEKQIKSMNKNIIAIGHTESVQDLAELYSAADVFLNPTRCDNFPTTNIESLSCGTPVITFAGTGSPESVGERCGIVVEKNNYLGILDAIEKMRKSGKNCNECIEHAKRYSKENAYNKYFELYNSI